MENTAHIGNRVKQTETKITGNSPLTKIHKQNTTKKKQVPTPRFNLVYLTQNPSTSNNRYNNKHNRRRNSAESSTKSQRQPRLRLRPSTQKGTRTQRFCRFKAQQASVSNTKQTAISLLEDDDDESTEDSETTDERHQILQLLNFDNTQAISTTTNNGVKYDDELEETETQTEYESNVIRHNLNTNNENEEKEDPQNSIATTNLDIKKRLRQQGIPMTLIKKALKKDKDKGFGEITTKCLNTLFGCPSQGDDSYSYSSPHFGRKKRKIRSISPGNIPVQHKRRKKAEHMTVDLSTTRMFDDNNDC